MPSLICKDCELPILATDIPQVLEWGKRKDALTHLGRPIISALHQDCVRRRRGQPPLPKDAQSTDAAAPKKEKASKAPSSPSAPKAPRAAASSDDAGKKIYRIVKTNPRKENTWGWKSFNVVKDGMTVAEYLKAGGRRNDLAWDVDHKFLELREK